MRNNQADGAPKAPGLGTPRCSETSSTAFGHRSYALKILGVWGLAPRTLPQPLTCLRLHDTLWWLPSASALPPTTFYPCRPKSQSLFTVYAQRRSAKALQEPTYLRVGSRAETRDHCGGPHQLDHAHGPFLGRLPCSTPPTLLLTPRIRPTAPAAHLGQPTYTATAAFFRPGTLTSQFRNWAPSGTSPTSR